KDYFYERLREKVKFVLIGCKESFRNCFCVSMGSNKTDNYSMALNIDNNEIYLDIKDEDLNIFSGEDTEFEVNYVKENLISLGLPKNINPIELAKHEMWNEYDSRCIGCGRCNFVCPTCTCFTMQDIYYKENENVGERRRVWASCQVDGYTDMAGGHSFRKKQGERMRFKVMHKIYDFDKRFGYQMCVGCGRCDDACPQYISFSQCVEKIKGIVDINEEVK
ncbi:anaerobic sulfite reductase subunit A, partial [Acinetobacter sp. RIT592]